MISTNIQIPLADGAVPNFGASADARMESQDGFSPAVIAGLTDIVLRFRSDFNTSLLRGYLPSIREISELSVGDFDKSVSALLLNGFFQFNDLLCGLEVLLLKFKEVGVVDKEGILRLQDLFIKGGLDVGGFVEVSHVDNIFGCLDGESGGGERG